MGQIANQMLANLTVDNKFGNFSPETVETWQDYFTVWL